MALCVCGDNLLAPFIFKPYTATGERVCVCVIVKGERRANVTTLHGSAAHSIATYTGTGHTYRHTHTHTARVQRDMADPDSISRRFGREPSFGLTGGEGGGLHPATSTNNFTFSIFHLMIKKSNDWGGLLLFLILRGRSFLFPPVFRVIEEPFPPFSFSLCFSCSRPS